MPKILDIGASTGGVVVIVSGAKSGGPTPMGAQLIWRRATKGAFPPDSRTR